LHDVYSYLVYAATGDDVEFSMVDGNVVVEDGSVTAVSESDVHRRAREAFEGRNWSG
jgi:cytosine/adenosine deaminase-related metal-dependent hydrolase